MNIKGEFWKLALVCVISIGAAQAIASDIEADLRRAQERYLKAYEVISLANDGSVGELWTLYGWYKNGQAFDGYRAFENRTLSEKIAERIYQIGGIKDKEKILDHFYPSEKYVSYLGELVATGSSIATWTYMGHYGNNFQTIAKLLPEKKGGTSGRNAFDIQRKRSAAIISAVAVLKEVPGVHDFTPVSKVVGVSKGELDEILPLLMDFVDLAKASPEVALTLVEELERIGIYELSILVYEVIRLESDGVFDGAIDNKLAETRDALSDYGRAARIVLFAEDCIEYGSAKCLFNFLSYMMPFGPVALVGYDDEESHRRNPRGLERVYVGRGEAYNDFNNGKCVGGFENIEELEREFLNYFIRGLRVAGFSIELGELTGCIMPKKDLRDLVFNIDEGRRLVFYYGEKFALMFPKYGYDSLPEFMYVTDLDAGFTFCFDDLDIQESGEKVAVVPRELVNC